MHIKVAHHLFSDTTFRRGYDYVNWGLVLNKPQTHAHVYDFTVVGTKRYHASITVDDGGHLLSAICDCKGKRYCKHLAASFVVLSQHKKDIYLKQPYLRIPEDFTEYVFNLDRQYKEIISILTLALEQAKTNDDTDVLFEAYEFYMEQMDWLFNHEYDMHAIELFEWMMDEFISYWTGANNDCIEMDFFNKQTNWIEQLVHNKRVDPLRVINNVSLWLELYQEINDGVINDWLVILSEYASDEEFELDLKALLDKAKENVRSENKLIEAHYFYSMHSVSYFPFESIDVNKFPKIARHLVHRALQNNDYETVNYLVHLQIQKKPKYEDIPWVSYWVMICEQMDDTEQLKEALRWLFYCGEINGYHQLKTMVDRRRWKDEVAIMLEQYQQNVFSDWTYRQLLVLEQKFDLLKEHVRKHPWFISQLNKHLIDVDPDFVYSTLKHWILSRFSEFKDEKSLQPWIVLFSSYFGEDEGYELIYQIKSDKLTDI